jgi:transposase-like protein
MRYSDDFRASTVLMLRAAGYPERRGALMEVANSVGVSHSLIRRWFTKEVNPPPSKIAQIKMSDIVEMLKNEVVAALQELPNARGDADYLDIGKVMGIMVDKLQLLSGEATERIVYELSDSDRSEQVAEILNAARAREARHPANGEGFLQ